MLLTGFYRLHDNFSRLMELIVFVVLKSEEIYIFDLCSAKCVLFP